MNRASILMAERQCQASLEVAYQQAPGSTTIAELCDCSERLLATAALRLEADKGLLMGLIIAILTPCQAACIMAASYPARPDWLAICSQLASEQ